MKQRFYLLAICSTLCMSQLIAQGQLETALDDLAKKLTALQQSLAGGPQLPGSEKPEPKSEPKSEPKIEPKPEPKIEPQPEPKEAPKPEPKSEAKTEPQPEPKSKPKSKPKPGTLSVLGNKAEDITVENALKQLKLSKDETPTLDTIENAVLGETAPLKVAPAQEAGLLLKALHMLKDEALTLLGLATDEELTEQKIQEARTKKIEEAKTPKEKEAIRKAALRLKHAKHELVQKLHPTEKKEVIEPKPGPKKEPKKRPIPPAKSKELTAESQKDLLLQSIETLEKSIPLYPIVDSKEAARVATTIQNDMSKLNTAIDTVNQNKDITFAPTDIEYVNRIANITQTLNLKKDDTDFAILAEPTQKLTAMNTALQDTITKKTHHEEPKEEEPKKITEKKEEKKLEETKPEEPVKEPIKIEEKKAEPLEKLLESTATQIENLKKKTEDQNKTIQQLNASTGQLTELQKTLNTGGWFANTKYNKPTIDQEETFATAIQEIATTANNLKTVILTPELKNKLNPILNELVTLQKEQWFLAWFELADAPTTIDAAITSLQQAVTKEEPKKESEKPKKI